MQTFFSSKRIQWVFIGCVVLLIVSAVAIRMIPSRVPRSGLPAFTSARFDSGDAVGSLGPEWTLVRQTDLTERNATLLAGTAATRETLAQLVGGSTRMLVTELTIVDAQMLQDALATSDIMPAMIAGRSGYIVRPPSVGGGSGFMIVGTGSALLLQLGDEQFSDLLDWPQVVPRAMQTYIGVVPVR